MKKFRYGFNGQEKTDEISGSGNHNTALFWEYDTRTGRRWNLDPKPTVGISDYACFNDNPIWNTDVNGDKPGTGDGDDKKKTASTEKPKAKPAEPKDPKAVNPSTLGKNFGGSNYGGQWQNPEHNDGTDAFEPEGNDIMDEEGFKVHDKESGGIEARTAANLKGDLKLGYAGIKNMAKVAENYVVLPIAGANPNSLKVSH